MAKQHHTVYWKTFLWWQPSYKCDLAELSFKAQSVIIRLTPWLTGRDSDIIRYCDVKWSSKNPSADNHEVSCGGESRHAGRHFSEIGSVVTDTKTQQSSSNELFILSKIEAIEFQSFWRQFFISEPDRRPPQMISYSLILLNVQWWLYYVYSTSSKSPAFMPTCDLWQCTIMW